MKKFGLAIVLSFLCSGAFATPPVYGPLQAQNNLDDVDSASTSLANLGGAPLASPTFTGTVTIPSGSVLNTPASINLSNATNVPYSSLPALSANQLLGSLTATTPSGQSVPSCSAATDALLWTSGVGFSCNTSINAGTLGGATFASPGSIGNTTPSTGKFTTLTSTDSITGGTAGNSGAGENMLMQNLNTATNTTAAFLAQTGTSNAYVSLTQFDGATPTATLQTASGDSGGLNIQAISGSINLESSTNLAGSLSGTGLTNYFSSPSAIGNTTPSSGAFTTLSASSTVSGAGFSTYLASPPAIGSTTPSTGKFTTIQATSTITPSTTAGIVGTTLGDNANAGSVGEYISQNVSQSSVNLSSGAAANIATLSLTAGDWDCSGDVVFAPAGSTVATGYQGWISTTSASLPGAPNAGAYLFLSGITFAAGNLNVFPVGETRKNFSSTTNVYLSVSSSFSTSTMTAGGFIGCRRVR